MRRLTWNRLAIVGLVALCLIGWGCAKEAGTANGAAQTPAAALQAAAEVTKAVCVLHPLGDSNVKGTVTFTKREGGIEVRAELTGLTPGDHGFHVHQWGDCTAADGTSTGGHYDPAMVDHGRPEDDAGHRHAGDFGNVTADANGNATYERVDAVTKLNGPTSIIGRGIIIHAAPDDFGQPTGNAGGRVACGVIGIANPAAAAN